MDYNLKALQFLWSYCIFCQQMREVVSKLYRIWWNFQNDADAFVVFPIGFLLIGPVATFASKIIAETIIGDPKCIRCYVASIGLTGRYWWFSTSLGLYSAHQIITLWQMLVIMSWCCSSRLYLATSMWFGHHVENQTVKWRSFVCRIYSVSSVWWSPVFMDPAAFKNHSSSAVSGNWRGIYGFCNFRKFSMESMGIFWISCHDGTRRFWETCW